MPAKPLTKEQLQEAARLKAMFKAWQALRKAAGKSWTQDEVSDEFGFGQSALSQYLTGNIPLNASAVMKFSEVLGVSPADISPRIVRQVEQEQQRAAAFLRAAQRAETPRRPTRRTHPGAAPAEHVGDLSYLERLDPPTAAPDKKRRRRRA